MTRAAKQKLARESTAAYAVSQPLFDAIRIACQRVGEQRKHLAIARDIVQHLHVQHSAISGAKVESEKYERVIDGSVKAWRAATQDYADVFEALALATQAVPSEGKEARYGWKEFEAMAGTAREAKKAVDAFTLFEDVKKAEKTVAVEDDDEEDEEEEEDEGEDEAEVEEDSGSEDENESKDDSASSASSASNPNDDHTASTTPTNPILLSLLGKRPLPEAEEQPAKKQKTNAKPNVERLSEKIEYDAHGRKVLWDRGAEKPNVPYGTLGSSEKKAWKAEKARQKREKKQKKRSDKVREENKIKNMATGPNGVKVERDRRAPANFYAEEKSKPVHDRDYLSLNPQAMSEPEPREMPLKQQPVASKVEYEDVSGEVEARLKAKEEKRQAQKKEKKRKRESGDASGGGDGGVVLEEHSQPKPKKARKANGGEPEVNGGVKVKKEKANKKHEREDDEVDGEKTRKKRRSKV